MDYEKKYKEIIEKIRKGLHPLTDGSKISGVTRAFLEEVFPELKESEGEKIRKALIRFHKSTIDVDGIKGDDIIAWLEKQYYTKKDVDDAYLKGISDAKNELEKQGEQKPAVIIPKFRVGDEIKTANEESLTITKIDEKGYWSEDLFICGFDNADNWKLVEQKPAWSEEDERICCAIVNDIAIDKTMCKYEISRGICDEQINWLQSLKDRIGG